MPALSPLPVFFFFNDTATTEIYTLSLHDALPICPLHLPFGQGLHPNRVQSEGVSGRRAGLVGLGPLRYPREATSRRHARAGSGNVADLAGGAVSDQNAPRFEGVSG